LEEYWIVKTNENCSEIKCLLLGVVVREMRIGLLAMGGAKDERERDGMNKD